MRSQTACIWFTAIRPFSLTASLIPVVLGSVVAMREGSFSLPLLLLTALAMMALQISSNLISDFDDFQSGVDTKASYGSSRMLVEGYLQPESVLYAGVMCLAAGCAAGLVVAYFSGPLVLGFGAVGALSAFFYTRKPFSFKYRGLGIPFVFLMFGPLPVLGAYYVQEKSLSIFALLLSIPVGLLTTAILHANDIRDIAHDRQAGIQTFSMKIGARGAGFVYLGFLGASYLTVLLLMLTGLLGAWSAVIFLTLPLAVVNIKSLYQPDKLIALDKQTAMLQMLFGAALILSVIIP